jgi:filamentous hemagglutinin family protein
VAASLRRVVTAAALLGFAQSAAADNTLRRGGATATGAASAAAAATAAQAAATQAQSPLRKAHESIVRWQALQDASRAATQAGGPGAVPNGLGVGGLDVAEGETWENASAPTTTPTADGRISVTVTQDKQHAILSWTTFNVGRETDLHFDQSRGGDDARSWVALNRVLDPEGRPSTILGSITAEGQVYLINRNGIIFGGSAQVSVGTLLASGLSCFIDDDAFLRGDIGIGPTTVPGTTPKPVDFGAADEQGGAVTLLPGARVKVASNGQVLLFGGGPRDAGEPSVVNRGSIEAPDGQVILAAGQKLSLKPSDDKRGFDLAPAPTDPGKVINGAEGLISTPRGSIVLAGSEVEQNGLLTATTGAEANGSFELGLSSTSRTTFGEGSVSQILPDEVGKKVVGSGTIFAPSEVHIDGRDVVFERDSTLYVPGGRVTVGTVASSSVNPEGIYETGRFYLAPGARIDVSGLRDVEVAMSQNTIEAELRAAQLQDNPVLLGGVLRGKKVYFDARLGVTEVGNLAGYYDLVERDIAQLMTNGGTVKLFRDEIITRQGSVIDLSGGSLRFLDGYVRSSVLTDPTGKRVRIENAQAGVPYLGIDGDFVAQHPRWGLSETFSSGLTGARVVFEKGYLQGGSAGTLEVGSPGGEPDSSAMAPNLDQTATGAFRVFDGDIAATTVAGRYQREVPSGSSDPTVAWRERPMGATLKWNRGGDVTIGPLAGPQLAEGFGPESALDPALKYEHLLPGHWFDGSTFTNVAIASGYSDDTFAGSQPTVNIAPGGTLTIARGVVVDLGDGGRFSFSGKRAELDGTLLAPGGAVKLEALDGLTADTLSIRLGATGRVDVAGRVSNDQLDGAAAPWRALHGGEVVLRASSLTLEAGSVVDVSGGARWTAFRNAAFTLEAGSGGSIVLDVSRHPRPKGYSSNAPSAAWLTLDGQLLGFALGRGGSLELDTPFDLVVGDALPADASAFARLIATDFFTRDGFASFTVMGERSLTVLAGTTLMPTVQTLELPEGVSGLLSGTRLLDVPSVRRVVQQEPLQQPMSLTLSTVAMRGLTNLVVPTGTSSTCQSFGPGPCLVVENGAAIRLSPGSALTLSAAGTLFVDGTLEALGGSISLVGNDKRQGNSGSALGVARVELGANARVLASGYVDVSVDRELVRREVMRGGVITVAVPQQDWNEVVIAAGAVLDASGITAEGDLDTVPGRLTDRARYAARVLEGSAGSILIAAGRGTLEGTYRLAPGGPSGAGGTLSVTAVASIVVRQSSAGSSLANRLLVVADRVNESGADAVTLDAGLSTLFFDGSDGDVTLTARRSLSLRAPVMGSSDPEHPASVTLRAAHVTLEGGPNPPATPFREGLAGTFTVEAALIDVINALQLGCLSAGCDAGGFKLTRLQSYGDLRFSDRDPAGERTSLRPGLVSSGALELDAAQIYVASRGLSSTLERAETDPGFLVLSADSIRVTGGGQATEVPLSFGERLTMRAPTITIGRGGVVRAPQGQVRLEGVAKAGGAPGSVTLEAGSLVSVSLEGATVPFGDLATGGQFLGYDVAGQAPTKSIRLDASQVSVEAGAVVDVSGGGDLAGFLFAQGAGGSRDILAASGTFAVLPTLGNGAAPLGRVASLRDGSLRVGDSVWLQGVPGLPDGFYTLLPARYALLPGGLLVRPLDGSFAFAPPALVQPDGSVVASGYRAASGLGLPVREQGFGRFLVMSREVFGQYSLLVSYSFNEAAGLLAADSNASVRTPNDAGSAVFKAQQLVLEGSGRFGAGPGGLVGNLDISATKIAVLGPGGTAPDASWVVLDATALSNFGAGSLLLGGTRSSTAAGTVVTVDATDVLVRNDASAPLTGQELVLAATASVSVADGSVLRATGAVTADTSPLLLSKDSKDGALLRLSTGARVSTVRTDATGTAGVLTLGRAKLTATGSLTLDGSQTVELGDGLELEAPELDLASRRVNLGDAPAGELGTRFSNALLTRLAAASDLLVRGYDSIHVYGDLRLGARSAGVTLPGIALDTRLLQGEGGTTTMTSGRLTLRNSSGVQQAGAVRVGALVLDVDELRLGPGDVEVAGFQSVSGTAGALVAQGEGQLHVTGSFSLTTRLVGGEGGADYALNVDGDLSLIGGDGSASGPPTDGLGAHLTLRGANVLLDTSVLLPAGALEATTTDATGTLAVGSRAVLDVSGRAIDFQGQLRFAPGGRISFAATPGAQGRLTIAAGAVLDVSGAQRGGPAGLLDLSAGGQALVEGTLKGTAAEGFAGGSFALDAATLGAAAAADFSALNDGLEAGGFSTARSFRLRRQDVVLEAGEALTAHQVTLRSDQGQVRVAGTISAAGTRTSADGGRVRLVGGNGVVVSGIVDAHAFAGELPAEAFAPVGGKVELVATGGSVDLAPGSVLDVSGGSRGGFTGGSVVVRAPRAGNDLAIDRLAGEIRGLHDRVVVQGLATYAWETVGAAETAQLLNEASTWLGNAAAIKARLGDVEVAPAIVVTSAGDLAITSAIDLHALGGPGYLGFVAAGGDLTVGATVSDGFDSAERTTGHLLAGRSFSLGFEAIGDITLEPGVMVRTGTGDLRFLAGGDLRLRASTSVIYTAGRSSPTAPGWVAPPDVVVGEFPIEGGDVELVAGGDIVAPVPSQITSAWLFRSGEVNPQKNPEKNPDGFAVKTQTSWSIVYRNFEQAVGALGGGDVTVTAGGTIDQLQVAIPTTGHLTTAVGEVALPEDLVLRGGGNLRLLAGADLLGGLFMLGQGHGDLRILGRMVGSELVGLRDRTNPTSFKQTRLGALFGLMDATVTVTATQAVELEGAFDPMVQGQIAENRVDGDPRGNGSAFWGYSDRTSLDATSVAGSLTWFNDPWASADLANGRYRVSMTGDAAASLNALFARAPGTLKLTSLSSDVVLTDRRTSEPSKMVMTLASASRGTLEVLARGDLYLVLQELVMKEVAPRWASSALRPFATYFGNGGQESTKAWMTGSEFNNFRDAGGDSTPLHAGDLQPVRLYALDGSVCATRACVISLVGIAYPTTITLPKALEVLAGRDVRAGEYRTQHNDPADLSWIRAGRDIREVAFQPAGEGAALLVAGRDLTQRIVGTSFTDKRGGLLNSVGNGGERPNLALSPRKATNLYVLAGAANGVDLDGFAADYLDPQNAAGVVKTYLPELEAWLEKQGQPGLSGAEAVAAFRALPEARREIFLMGIYLEELKATGLDYTDPHSPRYENYDRGFRAVARLFPTDPATLSEADRGDVILAGKTVETRAKADITILAPYGGIQVGAATVPAGADPAKGGLVTRRGGSIRLMADQNIDLFSSRVFTLQGGDITMWTSNGSITAGSGSKTSVFQVPLSYVMDPDGVVAVNAFGLATGAGIGVLDALLGTSDRKRSRLDLIAPRGEVNAGDSGIRVVGDLNIAAQVVVGLENIQVIGGAATGMPRISAPDVGGLATASQVATGAAKDGVGPNSAAAAAEARKTLSELPSIITVEVVGYETDEPADGSGKPRKPK